MGGISIRKKNFPPSGGTTEEVNFSEESDVDFLRKSDKKRRTDEGPSLEPLEENPLFPPKSESDFPSEAALEGSEEDRNRPVEGELKLNLEAMCRGGELVKAVNALKLFLPFSPLLSFFSTLQVRNFHPILPQFFQILWNFPKIFNVFFP